MLTANGGNNGVKNKADKAKESRNSSSSALLSDCKSWSPRSSIRHTHRLDRVAAGNVAGVALTGGGRFGTGNSTGGREERQSQDG